MLACRNVSGNGYKYCKICSACLNFQSYRNTFVNNKSEIRRLDSEIYDLDWVISRIPEGKTVVDLKSDMESKIENYEKEGNSIACRLQRLTLKTIEKVGDTPEKSRHYKSLERERFKVAGKLLKPNSKLIQVPHFFISISCPAPLRSVFNASEEWFPERTLLHGRRTPETIQGILESLRDREGSFDTHVRYIFRKLVIHAVKELHPELTLSF